MLGLQSANLLQNYPRKILTSNLINNHMSENEKYLWVSFFHSTINVNVKAIFNVTQVLLPYINNGGSIVNVSSLASLRALANHSIYSASKSAVDSLTRSFALEFGPRQIRVNSVNPTVVLTQMSIPNWSEPTKAEKMKSRIPLHRFAELNEVSDPIIFLLSDKSSFINGHSLPIEGGCCAC